MASTRSRRHLGCHREVLGISNTNSGYPMRISVVIILLVLLGCTTRSMEPDEFRAKLSQCAAENRCWQYSRAVLSSQFEVAECGRKTYIPPQTLKGDMPGVNCNEVSPYEDAVRNLPTATCNDTGEDWSGVPKCPAKP